GRLEHGVERRRIDRAVGRVVVVDGGRPEQQRPVGRGNAVDAACGLGRHPADDAAEPAAELAIEQPVLALPRPHPEGVAAGQLRPGGGQTGRGPPRASPEGRPAPSPGALTTAPVPTRRAPACTAVIRSPSRSTAVTGAERSTWTPLRAASSA